MNISSATGLSRAPQSQNNKKTAAVEAFLAAHPCETFVPSQQPEPPAKPEPSPRPEPKTEPQPPSPGPTRSPGDDGPGLGGGYFTDMASRAPGFCGGDEGPALGGGYFLAPRK